MYTSSTGHYPVVIPNMTKTKHFNISKFWEWKNESQIWRLCAYFFQRRKRLKETESTFIIKQEVGKRIGCVANWVSISLWYSWKGKQETHPCEQRKSKWRIWVWVSTSLDPSQHKGKVTLPGKVWGLLTRTSPLTGIWLNSYKQWGSLCPHRSVSDEGGHPSTIHPLWQLLSANSAPKWDLHHADIAQGVGECLPYWQRILSPLVS